MRSPKEAVGLGFDLDGTLIPDGALTVTSERTVRAFADMRKMFRIPLTARPVETALPIARQLNVEGWAVVAGGALVVDIETGEPDGEWRRVLSKDVVHHVIELCYTNNYRMRILDMSHDASPCPADEQEPIEATVAYALEIPTAQAHEILEDLNDNHINAFLTPSAIGKTDKYDLTVHHPEAQKHTALAHVCGLYGIKASQLAAVGDGNNDIVVAGIVGHFFAMKNGDPILRSIASEEIGSCQNNGVAQMIEQWFID